MGQTSSDAQKISPGRKTNMHKGRRLLSGPFASLDNNLFEITEITVSSVYHLNPQELAKTIINLCSTDDWEREQKLRENDHEYFRGDQSVKEQYQYHRHRETRIATAPVDKTRRLMTTLEEEGVQFLVEGWGKRQRLWIIICNLNLYVLPGRRLKS